MKLVESIGQFPWGFADAGFWSGVTEALVFSDPDRRVTGWEA